jgi:16S rRNA processing protein RimM
VEAGYLAVARFVKPHGLKGEAVIYLLTDRPDQVFVEGRRLVPLDAAGRPAGPELTVERARPFHRRWLVKFRGVDARTPLEGWNRVTLGMAAAELPPARGDGAMAPEDLAGAAVLCRGDRIGTATALIPVPGGSLLAVDVDGREVLVPYRPPIVVQVNMERREIEIDPPAGLLEL